MIDWVKMVLLDYKFSFVCSSFPHLLSLSHLQ